jgi:type II secretory pathway component PulL
VLVGRLNEGCILDDALYIPSEEDISTVLSSNSNHLINEADRSMAHEAEKRHQVEYYYRQVGTDAECRTLAIVAISNIIRGWYSLATLSKRTILNI